MGMAIKDMKTDLYYFYSTTDFSNIELRKGEAILIYIVLGLTVKVGVKIDKIKDIEIRKNPNSLESKIKSEILKEFPDAEIRDIMFVESCERR